MWHRAELQLSEDLSDAVLGIRQIFNHERIDGGPKDATKQIH
jgi:hypothetical protein